MGVVTNLIASKAKVEDDQASKLGTFGRKSLRPALPVACVNGFSHLCGAEMGEDLHTYREPILHHVIHCLNRCVVSAVREVPQDDEQEAKNKPQQGVHLRVESPVEMTRDAAHACRRDHHGENLGEDGACKKVKDDRVLRLSATM